MPQKNESAQPVRRSASFNGHLERWVKQRLPGQLIIQLTDHCNAQCPQCGMRQGNTFERSSLSAGQVRQILDHAVRAGIRILSFTGGEPLIFLDRIVELIGYAHKIGMKYIRTGTNGFIFSRPGRKTFDGRVERLAARLAGTPLRNFWISLDSYDAGTHETMRGLPGVVEGIHRALPVFHAHGLYPSANLGLNRNLGGPVTAALSPGQFSSSAEYLKAFRSVYQKALGIYFEHIIALGFTMCSICYPMSVGEQEQAQGLDPVYQATARQPIVKFTPAELHILFDLLLQIIPRYRAVLRIFTPLVSLYALRQKYGGSAEAVYPCLGGQRYFFVDARQGHIFPCGYRHHDDFGPAEQAGWTKAFSDRACTACDWECFCDPSEMSGPIWQAAVRPLTWLKKIRADRDYLRLWRQDLNYYYANRFFDGRIPHPCRLKERQLLMQENKT